MGGFFHALFKILAIKFIDKKFEYINPYFSFKRGIKTHFNLN